MSRPSLRDLLVEKGEDIWRDQKHVVREFPVDTSVFRRFLEKQREISGEGSCAARVLECLIEAIHRVTRDQLFEGIEDVASQLWSKIRESSDTEAYWPTSLTVAHCVADGGARRGDVERRGVARRTKASETGSGLMLRTVFSMVPCLICCDNSTIPGV